MQVPCLACGYRIVSGLKVNLKQLKRNMMQILNEYQRDEGAGKVGEVARNSFFITFFLKDNAHLSFH